MHLISVSLEEGGGLKRFLLVLEKIPDFGDEIPIPHTQKGWGDPSLKGRKFYISGKNSPFIFEGIPEIPSFNIHEIKA